MKRRSVSLLLTLLFKAGVAQADTVTGDVPDTLPGSSFGGLSGFMAGAATGGPIGGVVGAGLGWLVGGQAHEATGLTDAAYRVAHDDGSETVVRSPGRTWSPGDRVRVVGARLVEAVDGHKVGQSIGALEN
ncbi:MAG: hypothetical protein PVI28_06615 [Gammaproteobacteria bacterium]|jgi:outer membrane lipoprotein SlyB